MVEQWIEWKIQELKLQTVRYKTKREKTCWVTSQTMNISKSEQATGLIREAERKKKPNVT